MPLITTASHYFPTPTQKPLTFKNAQSELLGSYAQTDSNIMNNNTAAPPVRDAANWNRQTVTSQQSQIDNQQSKADTDKQTAEYAQKKADDSNRTVQSMSFNTFG